MKWFRAQAKGKQKSTRLRKPPPPIGVCTGIITFPGLNKRSDPGYIINRFVRTIWDPHIEWDLVHIYEWMNEWQPPLNVEWIFSLTSGKRSDENQVNIAADLLFKGVEQLTDLGVYMYMRFKLD